MKKATGKNKVDPFSFTTIASVCKGVFLAKFLPENWEVVFKENEGKPGCLHKVNAEQPCQCV